MSRPSTTGSPDARSSADPDGVSAQIDLIGVPWLNIGFEPSAAPNGGNARAGQVEEPITQCEKLFSVACRVLPLLARERLGCMRRRLAPPHPGSGAGN